MKITNIFHSRDKPRNLLNGSGYSFMFGRSAAGQAVNERSAMQMSAVYACVRILAESIASLPLHFYQYNDAGGKEKAVNHPLYWLLHDEPNPEMSSFSFRETLMTHLLLWGNAYAQIIRNGRGEVIALYPLMPDRMTVDRDARGRIYYEYTRSDSDANTLGKKSSVILSPEDVFHIPGLGFDGLVGYSPIAMAKQAIGMGLACDEWPVSGSIVLPWSSSRRGTGPAMGRLRFRRGSGTLPARHRFLRLYGPRRRPENRCRRPLCTDPWRASHYVDEDARLPAAVCIPYGNRPALAAEQLQAHLAQLDGRCSLRGGEGDQGRHQAEERHRKASEADLDAALLPAQFRYAVVRGGCGTADCHEDTGPHGLSDYGQYLHAPQFRDDEEIQRRYGRSIPPEAGSQRRTGQGQERKGKEIEETGCGCQPAVGWKILTDTMKAMTSNAPWPILFC